MASVPPSNTRHDHTLADVLAQEGNSLPSFLNTVFGFLSRHCPEEIYGNTHISGQHLISQSYCKWRQKYLEEKAQQYLQPQNCEENVVPPAVAEEIVIAHDEVTGDHLSGTPAAVITTEATLGNTTPSASSSSRKSSKSTKENNLYDSTNGAVKDSYAWTQTIEDLEVRIPVPEKVLRGKQVRVTLQTSSFEVEVQEPASVWQMLLTGKFPHSIKVEESLWSLVPGEHISIHLEKSEERWWDKLLTSEDSIDLKKINAERDYASLPQEDRQKIQEFLWNKQQQDQGKPTSDHLKMESVLREAWNAEGSPFQGQPFDPSIVNFTTGAGVGDRVA
ncbi:nudC domain-containing protein 3-like [Homarus americanus]|uniref:NudC domain-containing protein 3-like n=1 Tax=Homarus americanus TaxID=6706 RepID=A0A8J5K191_HOMAM|nr:nudC domain-containing protein 3-like [Homarus americanus]KAG7167712.1 NudC domain-containing protein 3-like [Homarus americanus]